jgi:hypothetical protein
MRIKVCISYYLEYNACKAGLAELEACKEHVFVLSPLRGSVLALQRNTLISGSDSSKRYQRPENGYDGFLTIDSDIEFTLDDVLSMISTNEPIVALPYETKSKSGVYQVGKWGKVKGDIGYKYGTSERGFKQVDWIGAGMHYVQAEVYATTEYPWYRHTLVGTEDLQSETGEDIGFCLNLEEHGYAIWCNFDNPVQHNKGLDMTTQEQEAPKLPNNIDTEVLKNISALNLFLTDIAGGWKLLTDTITNLNEQLVSANSVIADLQKNKKTEKSIKK